MQSIASLLLPGLLLSIISALSSARPEYRDLLPNGYAGSDPDSGLTCVYFGHTPCQAGETRNAFGLAFAAAGLEWTKELCQEDSDGDGRSNGEELGDPCCEWKSVDDDGILRKTLISNPGDPDDVTDAPIPNCAPIEDESPPPASPSMSTSSQPSSAASPAASVSGSSQASISPSPAASTSSAASPSPVVSPTSSAASPSPVIPSPGQASISPSPAASVSSSSKASSEASPSQSQEEDTSDSVCFPGHATVLLSDGSVRPMHSLRLGDNVLVAPGVYSTIFAFTHQLSDVTHKFVTLAANDVSITLTSGHYLYINGALAKASHAKVGDSVTLASGKSAPITSTSSTVHKGLYNPQTLHGDIVVDGVHASTYTTAISPNSAHGMLMPLRVLFRMTSWCPLVLHKGVDNLVPYLP